MVLEGLDRVLYLKSYAPDQNRQHRSALKLRTGGRRRPRTQARAMMCEFLSRRLGGSCWSYVGTRPGEAILVVVPEIEVPANRTKRACGAGSTMGLGELIRSRLLL